MGSNVGGSLEDIRSQAAASADTGSAAMEDFVDVKTKAQQFTGDVDDMAVILEGDLGSFTELVEQRSQTLLAQVESTVWEGRAADAKHARIADINGAVSQFRGAMDGMSADFKLRLTQFIEGFYATLETQIQNTVTDMQTTYEDEGRHADTYATALEDLDTAAAGA